MARGINKVILVGNLGADPETRYAASGNAVTRVRLATSEQWKDKQTGDQQERTEWHRVVFFGRLAEIAGEYLRKGSQVYIEGSLRTSSYEKEGQTHWSTDIVANEMQMLGGRGGQGGGQSGSQNSGPGSDDNFSGGSRSQGGAQSSAPKGGQGSQSSQGGRSDDFDDDIPF